MEKARNYLWAICIKIDTKIWIYAQLDGERKLEYNIIN